MCLAVLGDICRHEDCERHRLAPVMGLRASATSLAVTCLLGACLASSATEQAQGEVNLTPDNSEVWVRAQVYPSPDGKPTTRQVFVTRDSLGYQVDSDMIVV